MAAPRRSAGVTIGVTPMRFSRSRTIRRSRRIVPASTARSRALRPYGGASSMAWSAGSSSAAKTTACRRRSRTRFSSISSAEIVSEKSVSTTTSALRLSDSRSVESDRVKFVSTSRGSRADVAFTRPASERTPPRGGATTRGRSSNPNRPTRSPVPSATSARRRAAATETSSLGTPSILSAIRRPESTARTTSWSRSARNCRRRSARCRALAFQSMVRWSSPTRNSRRDSNSLPSPSYRSTFTPTRASRASNARSGSRADRETSGIASIARSRGITVVRHTRPSGPVRLTQHRRSAPRPRRRAESAISARTPVAEARTMDGGGGSIGSEVSTTTSARVPPASAASIVTRDRTAVPMPICRGASRWRLMRRRPGRRAASYAAGSASAATLTTHTARPPRGTRAATIAAGTAAARSTTNRGVGRIMRSPGRLRARDDRGDDLLGRASFDLGARGDDDAVAQHRGEQGLHVVGDHVVAPVEGRGGPGGGREHHGRARTRADLQVGVRARGAHHVDDVPGNRLGERHRGDGPARVGERLEIADRPDPPLVEAKARVARAVPEHQLDLVGALRMPDDELEQEAVELRLREGIRPLVLDRILRRDDQEAVGEGMRPAVERDLALLHRLEEGRLGLGRGAVDLVGEQHLGEDRPARQRESVSLEVEDVRADDIAGHEIGRELDPLELEPGARGEGPREKRLPDARHAFEQHVPPGEQAHHQQVDVLLLTDYDGADACEDLAVELPKPIEFQRSSPFSRGRRGARGPRGVRDRRGAPRGLRSRRPAIRGPRRRRARSWRPRAASTARAAAGSEA